MVKHNGFHVHIRKNPVQLQTVVLKHFCNFKAASLPALPLGIQLVHSLYGIYKEEGIFADLHMLLKKVTHLEGNLGILTDSIRIVHSGL